MGFPRLAVRVHLRGAKVNRSGVAVELEELAELAGDCEKAGADGLFLAPSNDGPDPYVALGACCSSTTDLMLGACPSPHDGRLPSLVAKVVTGLDLLSCGRAIAMVGAGNLVPGDVAFDQLSERLEILRAMVRVSAPSYEGRHFRIERAWNEPRVGGEHRTPIGLVIDEPGGSFDAVLDEPSVLDLATRFCEGLIVRVSSSDDESLEVFFAQFARRCRRSGRVPEHVPVLALVDGATREETLVAGDAERLLARGFHGVILDVDGLAPSPIVELVRRSAS